MLVNNSTRVEKARHVLCGIPFQKNIRVVGKRLVKFFALNSNPPLANTRQISTWLSSKHSLNVRVKKMQWNDKKIKELLNEHIREGRTHQAIQLGSTAVKHLHPEFAGLDRDLFLAPACFISGSSCRHQCTHAETVKQIQ